MAELSPKELQALIEKLDLLCEQAQALQRVVRERMADSKRRDQPDRTGQPERRKTARKK